MLFAKKTMLREAGFDEFWLRDQICDNTAVLNLPQAEGELEVLAKEKIQSNGRRLDLLLKDEEDKMFEVELMLGATDETHIVRTIAYWDAEQRKYPQRQHFAVLVAESFDRDFFNVIYRFSHSIPLIAIQVNLVEVEGKQALHFSKIIDTYEEPEDAPDSPSEDYDEAYWKKKAAATVETSRTLMEIIAPSIPNGKLRFVKSYIAIEVSGEQRIWIKQRRGDKSQLRFWVSEKLFEQATDLLDKAELSFTPHSSGMIYLTMDSKSLKTNQATITKFAELSRQSWDEWVKP